MKQYVEQLIQDIHSATKNLAWPYVKQTEVGLQDWKSREEEMVVAPMRNLQKWTGISGDMLPPVEMLNDEQVSIILKALKELLATCNCHVVFQTEVPERFQYEAIRQNMNQNVRVLEWNDGFFEFCKPGMIAKTCALGEYCQCAFYEELFSEMIDEELTPEEERARDLEFEVRHIQKKYDDNWRKYYPYHLDKEFDDENGNPHNYGFGKDDEQDDDWWRK
jgi:hypothetical protein